MARLTAEDMVAMVRDASGGETSETVSDTRILRYLNQALLRICSRFGFEQLGSSTTITTVSGTAAYELSVSDVLTITDLIDDTNNYKLTPMSEQQYNSYTQGSTSSGTPIFWFLSGVGSNNRYEITFYPTPAGVYTINVYYNMKPTEMVLLPTATSPFIPEPWDDSIIYRATAKVCRMLGNVKAAKDWDIQASFNDTDAKKSTYNPSTIPYRTTSIIARALM